MTAARRSVAGPDDGTEDPENTTKVNFRDPDDDKLVWVGIEWAGNGYDPDRCWITCDVDNLIYLRD